MWTIPSNNVEGRTLMAVNITFLILAFISFGIRVYARVLTRVHLDSSDYTCCAGLLFSVGLTVILWAVYSHGWGLDVSYFTVEYQVFAGKLFVAILIIWNTAVTMVRVSMLLFYIRIFFVSALKPVFWITLGLNIAGCVAVCIAALTICQPYSHAYNPQPGGRCGDILALQRFTAYWNLIADVAIVVLPMPILWSLKIGTQKKIGLSIIMGMGVFICAGTITRVILSAVYKVNNITKQNSIVVFITAMEPIVGIINACLPHFPPVFRRFGTSRFAASIGQIFQTEKSNMGSFGKRKGWSGSGRQQTGEFVTLDDDAVELNSTYAKQDVPQNGIHVRTDFRVANTGVVM
ncbi:hypothetical protein DM02DRAFT_733661 [Periconia macrospinosa]|uniref:Rhodopsin domain-containing protein n=1 Tax=Periconia macrospinosa TaxID=97972 RepID=A0A2V1D378_9PLEO|nr:hypothetical protein DM02DRAFT_733661 [Periconia macrospinosa]